MHHLKIFIELTRLNKPIGFMLLFWPCAWGLALANSINKNPVLFYHYLILFFLGSILMRSAGCIFNDIVDKDYDKKVWVSFGDKVGWTKEGWRWLGYSGLTFSENHYMGHLPTGRALCRYSYLLGGWNGYATLLSRRDL